MNHFARAEQLLSQYPGLPNFRVDQINRALFDVTINSWDAISVLPKDMRAWLNQNIPWTTLQPVTTLVSKQGDTHKAIVQLADGKRIETVLMRNKREAWTICASSQVGCAMGCVFCATGKMGLVRSLTVDEIVDQYRFWQTYLASRPHITGRISNIVMMGMGEPLANYNNLKPALLIWLRYTDLGPTRITVSTVGVLPLLEKTLTDPEWPAVRIAISLHSAIPEKRKQIVPTTAPQFFEKIIDWGQRYQKKYGNRRHHVTFEYIMIGGVNDGTEDAKRLAQFAKKIGRVKVNLIPYNWVDDTGLQRSTPEAIHAFLEILHGAGIIATRRKTMGDDIAAACGQLITQMKTATKTEK